MDQKEIARTWRNLIIPFSIGIFITGVSLHFLVFGENSKSQIKGLYLGILGSLLLYFSGKKIVSFKKFFKNKTKNY